MANWADFVSVGVGASAFLVVFIYALYKCNLLRLDNFYCQFRGANVARDGEEAADEIAADGVMVIARQIRDVLQDMRGEMVETLSTMREEMQSSNRNIQQQADEMHLQQVEMMKLLLATTPDSIV